MFEQHMFIACKAISPASLSPVSMLMRGFDCANHHRCYPDLSPQGKKAGPSQKWKISLREALAAGVQFLDNSEAGICYN